MGSTWFEIHSSIPITNPRIDNPRTGSGEELINDSSCNHDTNCGLVQWSAQSVLRRREQIAFRPGVSHYLPKHRRDKRREREEREKGKSSWLSRQERQEQCRIGFNSVFSASRSLFSTLPPSDIHLCFFSTFVSAEKRPGKRR